MEIIEKIDVKKSQLEFNKNKVQVTWKLFNFSMC